MILLLSSYLYSWYWSYANTHHHHTLFKHAQLSIPFISQSPAWFIHTHTVIISITWLSLIPRAIQQTSPDSLQTHLREPFSSFSTTSSEIRNVSLSLINTIDQWFYLHSKHVMTRISVSWRKRAKHIHVVTPDRSFHCSDRSHNLTSNSIASFVKTGITMLTVSVTA